MKIAILGAGALGLTFGGLLSKNNDVTLFEISDKAIEDINLGVTVDNAGTLYKCNPKACKSGESKEVFDLVFVSVKTLFTKSVLEANKAIIGPNTYLMTIQNGLGNKEILAEFVDEAHLILGITRTNAIKVSNNEAKRVNLGITEIGYTDLTYDFVKNLQANFMEAGFETIISDDIEREIWSKLFLNITTNPISAIYDCNIGECYLGEEQNKVVREVIKEAVDVANALGYDFDANEVYEKNYNFSMGAKEGKPSMWQDVYYKRKTEIDFMNGRVAVLGEKLGVPTPYNKEVTIKMHEIENNYNKA